MIEQKVQNPPINRWRGLLLVLAVAAAAVLGSMFFDWLGRYIGAIASALFIAFGCAIALYLLERYVLAFTYACGGGCLRVSRVYGRYVRPMQEIWLNSVLAFGAPDDVKRRFPGTRIQRAMRPGCAIEPAAVAYSDGARTVVMLLQPDKPLRDALVQAAKAKR